MSACRSLPLLLAALAAVVVGTAPGLAAAAPEAAPPDFDLTSLSRMIRWSGVFTSLFVVAGAWIALKFVRQSVERLGVQFAAQRLSLQKGATFLQFVVYVAATIAVIVLSFRLEKEVLAIIGGTIAVSVGFAVKDLVASFIAGIMIMVDRPFQVGDRVKFADEYGDITAIGLRSVRLQTLDDNTVTIPNNKFLNDVTSCGNYGALEMQVVMDFYIGVDQDVEHARSIVTEAALTSRYIFLPKPVVVLVGQMIKENYVAVRLRLKAYVLDTKYEKAFESDVNLRVMAAFRERQILPPAILHRTLNPKPPPSRYPTAPRV